MTPNVARLLRRYGVDKAIGENLVAFKELNMKRKDGSKIGYTPIRRVQEALGEPWWLVHRHHLHTGLVEVARENGCELYTHSRVEKLDYDDPTKKVKATTIYGQTHEFDLLIGSDGVNSIVRRILFPDVVPTPPTCNCAFRAIVPYSEIKSDPDPEVSYRAPIYFLMNQILHSLGSCPCQRSHNGSLDGRPQVHHLLPNQQRPRLQYGSVAPHPFTSQCSPGCDTRRSLGKVQRLRPTNCQNPKEVATWVCPFSALHLSLTAPPLSSFKQLLFSFLSSTRTPIPFFPPTNNHSIQRWPLLVTGPLPSWSSPQKNIVLIGDAAHSMTNHMAQGAATSMEDGAFLGILIAAHLKHPNLLSLPDLVHIYESERMPKAKRKQDVSFLNGAIWQLSGEEARRRDEAMMKELQTPEAPEGRVVMRSPNLYGDPACVLEVYGYDAEAHAADAVERWLNGNREVRGVGGFGKPAEEGIMGWFLRDPPDGDVSVPMGVRRGSKL